MNLFSSASQPGISWLRSRYLPENLVGCPCEVVPYHFFNPCILLQMTELENKTATTHNQCIMLEHSIADKEAQLQMERGKVEVS